MRVGILMLALTVSYVALPSVAVLERLGRASLFVYWIHVELVYGYASWLWRHRLPIWATALAYVAFCVLMYRTIEWRDRLLPRWPPRRAMPPPFAGAASSQKAIM
jgi:hypothetical protein